MLDLPAMRPALYARETTAARAAGRSPDPPFNEARALCAGNSTNGLAGPGVPQPSMRPALYARETLAATGRCDGWRRPFNEARALCAGNCPAHDRAGLPTHAFNEARALCAGNLSTPSTRNAVIAPPSMRPALYARETNPALQDGPP